MSIPASRHRAYKALRRRGLSKGYAAAVAVKGRTRSGRSAMARRAARTRRARRAR